MAARRRRTKPQPKHILWWQRGTHWATVHALGLLLILLGLLILMYLSLWIIFVWPQYYIPPTACAGLPLSVSLRYPYYVAVGDEGFVEVGLRNTGTQPISGTAVIAFGGDLSVHPVLARTNALSFKALPPGGITADRVRFTLNERPSRLRGTLPFTVQITADQTCNLGLPNDPMRLAPIPGLKTALTAVLSGMVSITALAGLLWEQIRKRLFPEKK
jgi:hypothetical protein